MKVASFLWIRKKKKKTTTIVSFKNSTVHTSMTVRNSKKYRRPNRTEKNPFHTTTHTHMVRALCVLFDFFNKWNGNDTPKQLTVVFLCSLNKFVHLLSSRMCSMLYVCMGQIGFFVHEFISAFQKWSFLISADCKELWRIFTRCVFFSFFSLYIHSSHILFPSLSVSLLLALFFSSALDFSSYWLFDH